MKKAFSFIVVLGFLAGSSAWAGDGFQVRVCGSVLVPADSGYKDVYGQNAFLPEIKTGMSLSGPFYLWAGYGLVSKKGETLVLKYEAKSTQHFISAGAGYKGTLSEKLEWLAEAGLLVVSYKEEAMEVTVTGSALGFLAGAGLVYRLGERFFVAAEAGYLLASDEVEGKTIKLGGLRAGLGLGIRF